MVKKKDTLSDNVKAQPDQGELKNWPRTDDGRLLCSPEHPMPIGNGNAHTLRWAHTNIHEVGPQRDGWPCGDMVTLKCDDCGGVWDSELPQ